MNILVYLLGGLVTLRTLHYLFLWMESKDWIYYKRKPGSSGLGNAFQELNSLANPGAREVLERKFEYKRQDEKEDH